jgi:hypothetical protein
MAAEYSLFMDAVAPAAAELTTRPLMSMAMSSCRFKQELFTLRRMVRGSGDSGDGVAAGVPVTGGGLEGVPLGEDVLEGVMEEEGVLLLVMEGIAPEETVPEEEGVPLGEAVLVALVVGVALGEPVPVTVPLGEGVPVGDGVGANKLTAYCCANSPVSVVLPTAERYELR